MSVTLNVVDTRFPLRFDFSMVQRPLASVAQFPLPPALQLPLYLPQ